MQYLIEAWGQTCLQMLSENIQDITKKTEDSEFVSIPTIFNCMLSNKNKWGSKR